MNVLLDTNVVLDVVLERYPFSEAAEQVFDTAKRRSVQLFLSATTVTDLFYIVSKGKGKSYAFAMIEDLLKFVDVAAVDKAVIIDALRSGFSDFEDAVQTEAAKQAAASIIVTRNSVDFIQADIEVCSPEEFVQIYGERSASEGTIKG